MKHLDQAEAHNHLATREIAAFLRNVLDIQRDSEAMVYITAVGGVPFADYIQGLPTQFMEIHSKITKPPQQLIGCGEGVGGDREDPSFCEQWRIRATGLESGPTCIGHGLHGYDRPQQMLEGGMQMTGGGWILRAKCRVESTCTGGAGDAG